MARRGRLTALQTGPGRGLMTGSGKTAYNQKLKNLFGSAVVGYWPLWESAGSTVSDQSGNARNGAYSAAGITYGQTGIGDGKTAISTNGTTGYVNLYSASLAAAFSGAEGTIMLWAKVAAGFWTDNQTRRFVSLAADGNNFVRIEKYYSDNKMYMYHNGGGTVRNRGVAVTPTTFFVAHVVWSKSSNYFRAYYNGAQISTDQTLGTWAGALAETLCCVGATNTTPQQPMAGSFAHCLLLNRPMTPAEVTQSINF